MSLLSVKISTARKLSLKEVKLPVKAERVEATPILVDDTPTEEEILFSNFVAINPVLKSLVDKLDLVSSVTGDSLRIVELSEANISPQEPVLPSKMKDTYQEPVKAEIKPLQGSDKDKLKEIALSVVGEQSNRHKDEIIQDIAILSKVERSRAERGFTMMLEAGILELGLGERYFLTGSTPF